MLGRFHCITPRQELHQEVMILSKMGGGEFSGLHGPSPFNDIVHMVHTYVSHTELVENGLKRTPFVRSAYRPNYDFILLQQTVQQSIRRKKAW